MLDALLGTSQEYIADRWFNRSYRSAAAKEVSN